MMPQDILCVVAGIDHDGFLCFFIGQDKAVHLERPDHESNELHMLVRPLLFEN